AKVKTILGKLGRLVDGKLLIPEEVVHYSEWLHVMRSRIRERQTIDVSGIRATIHPACHVYKMIPEDAVYDDAILEGNRVAVSTSVVQELGAQVIDYSTWYDCCGFGFRHIISEREFTRSFAIDRKIKVAVEEAEADVMIGHDTGCITTLDKNQWIGKAVDKAVELPIVADCQFAALACGAHPYKICQLHWHASPVETLMAKMGIDWQAAKAEFEDYLKQVEAGAGDNLYDPRLMVTSGPGFRKLAAE
ncbi:MAG: heterodisulfide reductase subunit B, partial [Alphaproteobacteria bacterium]|nr:heterodisulfide reductase subunit B [Alphaproteobacteria bacterium]